MRILHICLPVILFTLAACKNKKEQFPFLRNPVFLKADSLFDENELDSSFYYFNQIATTATDSLEIATMLSYMGLIQTLGGDNFGGQETYLRAFSYLDERNKKHRYCFQSIYTGLGNSNLNLKNYPTAIDYYDKALLYTTDNVKQTTILNNKALAYQKTGAYKQADSIYQSMIDTINKNDQKGYAQILSNLVRTKWLEDHQYPAAPEMQQALAIQKMINDTWGLNASYAHLADYYTATQPDSALYFAQNMYHVAQELDSPDDQLEALSKLINLSPTSQLKPYALRYQSLSDSLLIARNAAKDQFALIRYNAERNKADNLQLQKDNAQKKNLLLIGFVIAIAIISFITIRSRKRKQQMELASRQQQLKTSKKVHDVVANGLYRIMTEVEHKDTIEKESLLDKLEELYEQSRDISYEPPVTAHPNFQNTISELKTTFASPTTKVYITGNNQELWNHLSTHAQAEIEQVLQNLMINMKKHSQAQTVVLKFETQSDKVLIHYKDDGIGLSPTTKFGNGLTNTETRIKGIGGQFTFEPATKGLQILISIPTVQTT